MSEYANKLEKYCNDVLSHKIVAGVYTIKAVERFINDLKRQKEASFDYEYHQEYADILCSFAESLKLPDLNGKTLKLLGWQIFILGLALED